MKTPLLILGAGGHGRVLLELVSGARGFLDPEKSLHGRTVNGLKVLGGDSLLSGFRPSTVRLVNGVGVASGVAARRGLFIGLSAKGFKFATVVAPSALVSSFVELGEGAQVLTGAIVHPNARIGRNAVINTAAVVEHDCVVGDHAFVGPGAILCGGVTLEESAFLGAGCVLYPGVKVGRGARVAAGAVLKKNLRAGATAR